MALCFDLDDLKTERYKKKKAKAQKTSRLILNAWCISISLELDFNLIFRLGAKQIEALFEEQDTLGQS